MPSSAYNEFLYLDNIALYSLIILFSWIALDKLAAFIKAQHGDESYIYDPSKFPVAKNIIEIKKQNF